MVQVPSTPTIHQGKQCRMIGGSQRTRVSHLGQYPLPILGIAMEDIQVRFEWSGCIRTEWFRWARAESATPMCEYVPDVSYTRRTYPPSRRDWLSFKKLAINVKSRIPHTHPGTAEPKWRTESMARGVIIWGAGWTSRDAGEECFLVHICCTTHPKPPRLLGWPVLSVSIKNMPSVWSTLVLPALLVGVRAADPLADDAVVAGTYAADVKM
jgi:hypothetical protein